MVVDKDKFALLKAVADSAAALGIPWLLTGAGGRMLLLEKLQGLPTGRATEDLDFGVMVPSWEHYEKLRGLICQDGRFHEDSKQSQRLCYGGSAKVDLVPFGAIAEPDERVRWPKEDGVVMNVLGFQEACNSAILLTVNGSLAVPVATPQAMLLLKLVAWEDRHARLPLKDASDIAYLLYHGEKIIGTDALYDTYPGVMEGVDWDVELATARAFGLQMAALAFQPTRDHLVLTLGRELEREEESVLVREVAIGFRSALVPGRTAGFSGSEIRNVFEALNLLRQLLLGLTGVPTP